MSAAVSLDKLEKAITQLIIAHGFIEHHTLIECIDNLRSEFEPNDLSLEDIFGKINTNLKPLAMEVKSVSILTDRGSPATSSSSSSSDQLQMKVQYHGIVNIEEDFVSKQYGSQFSA